MNDPRLSLCLIVRDEEAMLPDFLASVDGLWDEFIAVDTGSRDGSVQLLEAAGARLVPFTWTDDFAAARNASLEKAGGRWILFLDADERVSPELHQQIRQLLDDESAGAATLVMRNRLPGGHSRDSRLLRLFHNRPEIRFRYRIHEDVADAVHDYLQATGLALRHLDGVVDHLGYVRQIAADRDKKERDLRLLRLSLQQDPRDFYCRFKTLEIARFWDDRALWKDEAGATAALLQRLSPEEKEDLKRRLWSGELAGLVAGGLDGPAEQALAWLNDSASWARPTAAWLLHRALLLEKMGQADEAALDFQACLDRQGHPEENASQLTGVRPLLGLFRLAVRSGDAPGAARWARQAAAAGPLDPEAMLALVTVQEPDTGLRILESHLQANPLAVSPLAEACLTAHQIGWAAALLRRGLSAQGDDPDPDLALGLLVCTLVLGEGFDGEIKADQEQADALMRKWVKLLWQSRHTEGMTAFADNCQAVTGVFPWLGDFLAEETRKISSSRR
jgi:glycosyltransferase involved in cell wall biosynthesis